MLDHKVYFYLLKKEFYPKDRTLDPKFVTTPFPLKTSKSTIHDVILAKSQYLTIDRKSLEYKEILNIDNYDRIVLENTGFKLRLVLDVSDRICGASGRSPETILVEIIHPELEKYYPVYTSVDVNSILRAICRSGEVEDSIVSGTFSFLHEMSYYNTNIVLEDFSDKSLLDKKEKSKLIATTKGTSKWIPGHRYLLKSGKSFIYLGNTIQDKLYSSYSGKNYNGAYYLLWNSERIGRSYCAYECPTNVGKVVIFDDQLEKDMACNKFLDMKLGTATITEFIGSALQDYRSTLGPTYCWSQMICMFSNKIPVTAIDMGEVFIDDTDSNNNITEIISVYFWELLQKEPNNIDSDRIWYLMSGLSSEKRKSEEFKSWWKEFVRVRFPQEVKRHNSRGWTDKIHKNSPITTLEELSSIFATSNKTVCTSLSSEEINDIIEEARKCI